MLTPTMPASTSVSKRWAAPPSLFDPRANGEADLGTPHYDAVPGDIRRAGGDELGDHNFAKRIDLFPELLEEEHLRRDHTASDRQPAETVASCEQ